ncbi:phosphonoacetaldehyde reductase [Nocardia terpenica]|uniref:Iron-containing alcohol dehydrogenase n=1 Tax=Nocardia terpenica TaxID=455432 RepID=A0A6G9Z488_9NOCA|nr:phosphonoacetaldehyde reductase [Nocardia terpenica]QIS20250.1 iron-containing alcohol dehydrogenase [Nocardia terpenica]
MIAPPTGVPEVATLDRLPGHPAAYFGAGAAGRIADIVDAWHAERVLLVHGPRSFRASGAERIVEPLAAHRILRHFDGVRANPTIGQVAAGVAVVARFRPDVVIGIGGGSALDTAKAMALLAAQSAEPQRCLSVPALIGAPRTCGLLLVPTTAGAGSEVTRFATVYRGFEKYSIDHPGMRADVAVIDPELTASLAVPVAVAGALDAFSQAIESWWAVRATAFSRVVAADAVQVLGRALGEVLQRGDFDSQGLRSRLAWGAALAGVAIDISRTTAAHALSYALTARLGIPHGVAVALHLPWLLEHNARITSGDCAHPLGPGFVRDVVAAVRDTTQRRAGVTVPDLVDRLLALGRYPQRLGRLGLSPDEWAPVVRAAVSSARAGNNPRPIRVEDVLAQLMS